MTEVVLLPLHPQNQSYIVISCSLFRGEKSGRAKSEEISEMIFRLMVVQ